MSKLDDRILEAMSNEDRDLLETYTRQPGFFTMLLEPFRGSFGPIVLPAIVLMLAALGTLVYSAFRFFPEPDLLTKLNWLAIGLAMLIIVGFLRMWYFQEVSRLSVIREVKRLELQISLLSKKLG